MAEKKIQAIRGMNDWLPNESHFWQQVETKIKHIFNQSGYKEVRTPILESTKLFQRAVGEVTDIVEKEMYTFLDRNDESITLRPELTAGCVRMGIEHGLLYHQEQRLWYFGPAFRYERPQKGRYRQFHQFGVEVFGISDAGIDAELILMAHQIWKELGILEHVELQLNTIGTTVERQDYKLALVDYLKQHYEQLDEDSKRRLTTNPLRILDSKNAQVQAVLVDAPKLSDYLGSDSLSHFAKLCDLLDQAGISYQVNPCLVRGLDYYNGTVFEWVTNSLGAQGTVCGGGRYDGLVAQLGGQSTPGIGFGIGVERLLLLIETIYPEQKKARNVDVYIITDESEIDLSENEQDDKSFHNSFHKSALGQAQKLSQQLKNAFPDYIVMNHYGQTSIKKQFIRADKLGAKIVILIGEGELRANQITVKNLVNGEQFKMHEDEVIAFCAQIK